MSRTGPALRLSATAAAVLGTLAGACASAQPPPGGEDDRRPPRVAEVEPDPLAPLGDLARPVVFRFDERISERGVDQAAVLVSPRTGPVQVERGRREIRVRPVAGWEPETVYRVVLLPGVQDLFGNVRGEAAELVFSTGPSIANTAIAGMVTDRITGRPVAGAMVEALRRPDSLPYVALTDSAGFFAIRHVPPAAYALRAYRDANRNRSLDPFEERGETELTLGVSDTAITSLALLAPDTTPAVLAQATVIDSLAVRLLFDDHLDPERPPREVRAALLTLPDSVAVPLDTVVFPHRHAALRAARDTAAADTAVADTAAAPADTVAPRPPAPAADTALLPTRELILVPEAPLAPESRYLVRVEGVVNLHGLGGGGGEVELRTPARDTARADVPPADTIPADTVPPGTVPPDTVPPDTVPPDTVPPDTVPPDTVSPDTVSPDTIPPDTVPPDTVSPDTVSPDTVSPDHRPRAATDAARARRGAPLPRSRPRPR